MAQERITENTPLQQGLFIQCEDAPAGFAPPPAIATVDTDARAIFLWVGEDDDNAPDGADTGNPFWGKTIACPIGEGLLEFIQAPFEREVSAAQEYLLQGGSTAEAAARVAANSHYTNALLPRPFMVDAADCEDYFSCVLRLQRQYKEFVKTAFEQAEYEQDIKNITAATRFYFYCMVNETHYKHSLRRRMALRRVIKCMGNTDGTFTEDVSESLPPAGYRRYLEVCTQMKHGARTEQNAFEREHNLPATFTELSEVMPALVQVEYEIASLDDMLALEFEQMLSLDCRVKHCKNCGRYFVLKGNYSTDYCDKIPKGEKKPCQLIAASNNYARKLTECPPLAWYNKEYKRLHARMRTGSLAAERFEEWKKKAKRLRDDCVAGKLPEQEYLRRLSELRPG